MKPGENPTRGFKFHWTTFKIMVGVDEVKCFTKSGAMTLEVLSTAIAQAVVLMCQASQSIRYQSTHNIFTSLLGDP